MSKFNGQDFFNRKVFCFNKKYIKNYLCLMCQCEELGWFGAGYRFLESLCECGIEPPDSIIYWFINIITNVSSEYSSILFHTLTFCIQAPAAIRKYDGKHRTCFNIYCIMYRLKKLQKWAMYFTLSLNSSFFIRTMVNC